MSTPLPRLLLLTDRRQARAGLPATVEAAADAGVRAVVLREKDLPRPERRRLALTLTEVLAPRGGRLLVASDPSLAAETGAAGVHLAAADPLPDDGLRTDLTVGRSCHDGTELEQAAAAGIDYATLSPVFPSRSKPGYGPALEPAGFAALAVGAGLPVYALGGIDAHRVRRLRGAGAHGIAVMGAVMRAADPGTAAADLLDALAALAPSA